MSFPKLNDFIGKGAGKLQYKRISLIHSIKNSLARNTIVQSCIKNDRPHQNQLQLTQKSNSLKENLKSFQSPTSFKYEQKMPSSFDFSAQDMYKLLEHLFNKKQHDMHDRNFIRRLMLKYFPEQLICAGGKDFVSLLKFDKLRKGQCKIYQENLTSKCQSTKNESLYKPAEKSFYFILKGKVRIFTEEITYKKASGQYFGELEILGQQNIVQIEARSDTMFLILNEENFNKHLGQYFISVYTEIRKKISLFDPILNLTSVYNQYRILQLLYEKEYKTGEKVYQKGEEITELVFLNTAEISSTQNKILNDFKAVGFGELLTMKNPRANQSIYCMENRTVYAIKTVDLLTFIDLDVISNHISSKYCVGTLSGTKILPSTEDKTINSRKSLKLETFVNRKKVRFTNNNRRILTEPNSAASISWPSSSISTPKYPEFSTSFVFIKQNSPSCFTQMKSKRLKSLKPETPKNSYLKEYLLKTKNSFKKKRWLDEIDTINSNSIICNPEKLAKYETIKTTHEIKQFVVGKVES